MNDHHLETEQLTAYRHRQLSPNELLEASDHLAGCAECRARLVQVASSESQPSNDNVTYEELVAWLDEEVEPIERHHLQGKLSRSLDARLQLADLARFKAEMSRPEVAPARNIVPVFFGRWALPLAAALALTIGGLWWAAQSRTNSAAFVRLNDGGRELRIARDGEAKAFSHLSSPLREALKTALMGGDIRIPKEIKALAGRSERLAGSDSRPPNGFQVLAPVATAVRDDRPRFRWTPLPETTAYRIRVVNSITGEAMASEMVAKDRTEWSPAEALAAGQSYEWEVEALKGEKMLAKAPEPPQPEARFAIISQAQRIELERATNDAQGSHLVAGMAEAQAGLLDDANAEFLELAKENPDSEIPRRLIQQLHQAKEPTSR